jgi:hypothetical protein
MNKKEKNHKQKEQTFHSHSYFEDFLEVLHELVLHFRHFNESHHL